MSDPASRAELVDVVREVRRRWRLKLAARGAAIVIGGTVLALLVSASGLEALRFSSHAIIGFRAFIMIIVAPLLARWVVAPLLRRVNDIQVAMYLEECDPSLQAQIFSAVEASAADSPSHSPALVDRLVALALRRCRTSEAARAVDPPPGRGPLWTLGRVLAAAPADRAAFEGMLFPLDKPIDYYVEAGGVRSPMFSMTLVDLPTVRQLDLEYHYPSYTGLAPQKVESGASPVYDG